jgi:predicted nucleic acid-binding protein
VRAWELTRLPPPHRAPAALVRQFLAEEFPAPYLRLQLRAYRELVLGLANHGVVGGGVYDALVAATAATNDAELVTFDRRAAAVYRRYDVRLVAP